MTNSHGRAWSVVSAPPDAAPPRPITMRAQSIPARHHFPNHVHDWHQVVYAIEGVLTVSTEGRSFAISPEQAAWVPTGATHRVGSLLGAEFRSLWIADEAGRDLPGRATVLAVSPLLKALIVEAAELEGLTDEDGYAARIATLILDQLRRARPLAGSLPWPRDAALLRMCEALYADPADERTTEDWARQLGMSSRTLARRFEAQVGSSQRSWRRRLRLFRAIELMGGGMSVTEAALELGYGSASAFVFAFRSDMGISPQAFIRSRNAGPRQPSADPRHGR